MPRIRPVGIRRDDGEPAVTDVLGALLLVGLTVVMAVGLGFLLLSYDGPPDTQHSRLAVSVLPGQGGWGTGDEQLRIRHLGGEPLSEEDVRITIVTPAGTQTVSAAALGFSSDELRIGGVWTHDIDAALNDLVEVQVVIQGPDTSQLLANTRVTAGASGGGALCLGDTNPPTAGFTQSPADVTSITVGAVTVTVALSDDCAGVDEASVPHLLYCVAVVCTIPTSYTDAGAMTDIGVRTWSTNVPSHTWLTEAIAGKSLRYYVTAMEDLNGNTAQSAAQVDVIDLLLTYVPVSGASATTGAVTDLPNAQVVAADSQAADLAEGAVTGTGTTVGPTKYSGTTATNGGALTPNNVLASDDARAEIDATNEYVEVTGIDLPANAATITGVTIGYEGRKASSGGTSPTMRIDYKLGSGGTYSLGTSFTESATTDTDRTRSLCTSQATCASASLTVGAVESIYVRAQGGTDTNRNPQVDHVFVTVTYITAPSTNYATDIQLEWTNPPGIPSGLTQTLELRYYVQDDTFNVQVWNFVSSSWRTCAGTLTSTSYATYSCSLNILTEYSAGEARMRFTDATPTGLVRGHIFLDYARSATA